MARLRRETPDVIKSVRVPLTTKLRRLFTLFYYFYKGKTRKVSCSLYTLKQAGMKRNFLHVGRNSGYF